MLLTDLVMPWLIANACRLVCVITMPSCFRPSVSPVNTAFNFSAARSVDMFLKLAISAASCVRLIAMFVAAVCESPMPVAMSP